MYILVSYSLSCVFYCFSFCHLFLHPVFSPVYLFHLIFYSYVNSSYFQLLSSVYVSFFYFLLCLIFYPTHRSLPSSPPPSFSLLLLCATSVSMRIVIRVVLCRLYCCDLYSRCRVCRFVCFFVFVFCCDFVRFFVCFRISMSC